MHKKWYELGANILAYVIGQIESINVKYQGDTLPIRIFGKTYFDPIHIIGENGILKVITISNKVKTYKLVNLKELGIRWVDKDKLTSFWDTNDELPFFIASGYIEENNNKPNNICNKHSEFELQIKNALSFLASNFEEYYLWIILNLKELSPLQKPAHCQTQSQTSLALPGHIEINNQASLIEVINMLVHECSHLYFHLLQLSHPLCTHDAPMCYSILKERERPLINVLLGFHAFANVLILLTKIKIAKLAEIVVEELDEHLKHVLNYVLSLDKELSNHIKYLRENTGLVIYYTLKSMLIEQGYFT
ncbi:aKG-HExxH-type peptide beta-hydroxylase [Pseudoalteromonas sp. MMG012]|uniref:aKG-HExxH-type peptide beta-hydroxylase n=1 Tax=Pseudoalteromonas sp. MMG012 TaxID=2822686 RepID=UPI001B3A316A|nr:HEXXH motif-containing putative peptide modification protein [Pseudoalteromonas sp. MMG012]MBQ4851227.1 hypothetical protein [Pseudoalteromonas sp. MMG012]